MNEMSLFCVAASSWIKTQNYGARSNK